MDQSGESKASASGVKWKDSELRSKHDASFFVCWFEKDDEEGTIAEMLKDELWPNPLAFFSRVWFLIASLKIFFSELS